MEGVSLFELSEDLLIYVAAQLEDVRDGVKLGACCRQGRALFLRGDAHPLVVHSRNADRAEQLLSSEAARQVGAWWELR